MIIFIDNGSQDAAPQNDKKEFTFYVDELPELTIASSNLILLKKHKASIISLFINRKF